MATLNEGEREYYFSKARRDARIVELNGLGLKCRYRTWKTATFKDEDTVDGAEILRTGQTSPQRTTTLYSVEIKTDLYVDPDAAKPVLRYADLDPTHSPPTIKRPVRRG